MLLIHLWPVNSSRKARRLIIKDNEMDKQNNKDLTPVITAEDKPTESGKRKQKNKKHSLSLNVLIVVIFLLIIFLAAVLALRGNYFFHSDDAYKQTTYLQEDSPIAGIVIVDTGILISAQIEQALDYVDNSDDMESEAESFSSRLSDVLQEYVDSGYVVLKKSSAVAYPNMLDITPYIADRLDLVLPNVENLPKFP